MSSSPDKTDARSMSDILASIRKIMAQDPESAGAVTAKPPANGAESGLRAGVRVPAPDAPREPANRDQVKPTAAAPVPAPAPVSAAPTPAAISIRWKNGHAACSRATSSAIWTSSSTEPA